MPKNPAGGDQDINREPILNEFQDHIPDAPSANGHYPGPVGQEDIHVADIQGHPPLSVLLLTSSDDWKEIIPRAVLTPQQVDAMKLIMTDRSIVETGDMGEEEIFKFEAWASSAIGGRARREAIEAEGGRMRRLMGGMGMGVRRMLGGTGRGSGV